MTFVHDIETAAFVAAVEPGEGRRVAAQIAPTDAPVLSLDGPWRFRLGEGLHDLTPSFGAEALDDANWDEIAVPSSWQIAGLRDADGALLPRGEWRYGAPAYTNIRYPFPVDPPAVPNENPVGEYRRRFEHPGLAEGEHAVLRFEGVDSSFSVWVNGVAVGWGTGSRLATEFDVTALIRAGENTVAVRVLQWSAATYLEDQDMWWVSGIFRSVSLRTRPVGGIDEHRIRADYDATTGEARLLVETDVPATVRIPELAVNGTAGETMVISSVEPWTAETPRLYDAEIASAGETLRVRIGFRTLKIVDGELLVNGSPIRLRGVNRHEWHPDTGRTLDVATMLRDIELLKTHNINAVRTSHYPPDPRFLDLCDEHGLYVIDECDVETHGFVHAGWVQNPPADPRWRAAMLDRAERMLARDRNHPSVIMWSLGNEAGAGDNLQAMADLLHAGDDRPVHYEGDQNSSYVDVYSRMYAAPDEVALIGAGVEPGTPDVAADARRRRQPFLLCEYAHAMGNGPGALIDYERLFDRYPRLLGGFVWEWMDQGITQVDARGREFVAYGGDFDEALHDSTYIIDGLVFADRTPSPGLTEYAAVISPVRLTVGSDAVRVENRHDHVSLDGFELAWRVEVDGDQVASGTLALPEIGPRTDADIALPILDAPELADGQQAWLTIDVVRRADADVVPAGHVVGTGQRLLAERTRTLRSATPAVAAGDGWRLGPAEIDDRGRLVSLGGRAVTTPVLDIWRALTDNDSHVEGQGARWLELGFDRMLHRTVEVVEDDGAIRVETVTGAAGVDSGFATTWVWTAVGDAVHLRARIRPHGQFRAGIEPTTLGVAAPGPVVTLPRLGITFALDGLDDRVRWFGLGPGESYPDSRQAVRVGAHETSVAAFQTPYAHPQENGARQDVRWAEISGAEITGRSPRLRIEADESLGFTVRPWRTADLERATHAVQLEPSDRTWITLDVAQAGLGTASCGPDTLPPYLLHPQERELGVTFIVD